MHMNASKPTSARTTVKPSGRWDTLSWTALALETAAHPSFYRISGLYCHQAKLKEFYSSVFF
jgi:hypothetical protein